MAKELIWSEEMEHVYGWYKDFKDQKEFIDMVKLEYDEGECKVVNIKRELCFVTEKGLQPEMIIPVNLTDITMEEFYTAKVEQIVGDTE